MRLILALMLCAGCGAVIPDENTSTQSDDLIPACGDLKCDVISCSTCTACPGIPTGTTTCTCGTWNADATTYPICTVD